LLTIKAVNAIAACGVIAAPRTGGGEGAALTIIERYLAGKTLLECSFPMDKDVEIRKEARRKAAADIIRFLEDGKDVGFVTLGDPTTYSTYMYIHEIIAGKGFGAEIIPGVTSYSAAAAAFGVPLCEGGETLTIIPAGHGSNDLDELLDRPGNKVVMKSGGNLASVVKKLKERGCGDKVKIACRVTMEGQRLYRGVDEFEKSPEAGYFTLALIKE
jgi:precorrin-2/cobalt-factor-2 C20-methyltransferase